MSTFNFGTNLDPAGGEYLTKIIFDLEIEISIPEILDVPEISINPEYF